MPTWKYNKGKEPVTRNYLYFEEGKPKELVISDWSFDKHTAESPLFKCYVSKEDGKDVDKVWSIWDYDFVQVIKQKLKGKINHEKIKLKVIMHSKDELEKTFELVE